MDGKAERSAGVGCRAGERKFGMEYGEKFKKSVFGGFNRRDVLKCIEELNAHSAEELEAKQAEKDQLEAQVKDLEARLDVQRKANEELASKNESQSLEFADFQEKIDRAIAVSNELKDQLELQQKEIQTLKAANSELSVKKSLLEENNRALKARVEELEETQSGKKAGFEIGEMMVEAKKTADSIVNRASRQADAAHTALEAETAGISARLADIRAQLSAAGEDFKVYSGNILRSLEEMQRTIEESRQRLAQPVRGPKKESGKAPAKGAKDPYGFLFQK